MWRISNKFNKFFVNVGSDLAKEINEQGEKDGLDEKLVKQNGCEILVMVAKFKN